MAQTHVKHPLSSQQRHKYCRAPPPTLGSYRSGAPPPLYQPSPGRVQLLPFTAGSAGVALLHARDHDRCLDGAGPGGPPGTMGTRSHQLQLGPAYPLRQHMPSGSTPHGSPGPSYPPSPQHYKSARNNNLAGVELGFYSPAHFSRDSRKRNSSGFGTAHPAKQEGENYFIKVKSEE